MKLKNILLVSMLSLSFVPLVSATIGNKIDVLVGKTHACYEHILLEARFASGVVPALTIENIKKYPQHKQDYLAYAAAHINTLDPLVLAALAREYPADVSKSVLDALAVRFKEVFKK